MLSLAADGGGLQRPDSQGTPINFYGEKLLPSSLFHFTLRFSGKLTLKLNENLLYSVLIKRINPSTTAVLPTGGLKQANGAVIHMYSVLPTIISSFTY